MLISCFAKLFTAILIKHLKTWADNYNIFTDAQFGFKSDFSMVEAIFVLSSLIERSLQNKELFCCFVDYHKAFNGIVRNFLWYKSGVDGKLSTLLRLMYHEIKLTVKHMNTLSDIFNSNVGLLQGEITSPILFLLFLNDIELSLQRGMDAGITIDQISLFLLLFADDAAKFSESSEGLQASLNNLHEYCSKWNLTVNTNKTKIVVFRRGGMLNQHNRWLYGGNIIEIVEHFHYLDVVL